MSRYRNKYSSSTYLCSWRRRQRIFRWSIVGVVALVVVSVALFSFSDVSQMIGHLTESSSHNYNGVSYRDVQFNRIHRSAIRYTDFSYDYGRLFCDINDTQMQDAQRLGTGVTSDSMFHAGISRLVPIRSNDLYAVDYMSYSKPALVPEAVVLLQYIGERFDEIVRERRSSNHYRPIVTSAFRTANDVARLRRVNGNASDNSCHCFGTTFDITYSRFMNDNGLWDEAEGWMVESLARALYELRYEGLCHVRYERRQSCFHITVRDVEYSGGERDTMQTFSMPYALYAAYNGADAEVVAQAATVEAEAMMNDNVFKQKEIRQNYSYSQYIEIN